MENVPEHIDVLIAKFLAGETNAGEEATLEEWLDTDEEHKGYFKSLEMLFNAAATGKQWEDYDTDAAWNALRERMGKSQAERRMTAPRGRSISWYWKAAAVLVLMMVAGYLIVRQRPEAPVAMIVESGRMTRQDTLPDGSTAFLNTSTTLAYHYTHDRSRRLTLEGEAYFEVGPVEDSPFIVECSDVFIEDIGTIFNVRAYPGATTVEVFVESGEVRVYTALDAGLHLTAGETGIYNRQTGEFAKSEMSDENILSYKTRVFNFSDRDLRSVVEDLNKVYATQLTLADEKLGNCRLDVAFRDESIGAIADIIAETLGLTVTRGDGEITLEGTGCEP